MPVDGVALIPKCAECEAWLPADEERWRAYLGGDDLEEPPEVVFFCPDCAEQEFGETPAPLGFSEVERLALRGSGRVLHL